MNNRRTIFCGLDHRRLFDTNSGKGIVEIKCLKCKNVIRVDLESGELHYLKLNIRIATSK